MSMEYHSKHFYSVLTNGEIELRIKFSKNGCGVDPGDLPDGAIIGHDNCGNIYINGKIAKIEFRKEEW